MIEIENLEMSYAKPRRIVELITRPFAKREFVNALKPCSLRIEEGEKVVFLGENGAGKTTLLKSIAGLLYPTRGTIKVNGINIVKENMKARQSVSFVLNEERGFYWRLTGRQNLQFFGKLDIRNTANLDDRIEEIMERVGLEHHADRPYAGYSSGMKQRLSIARGLLSNPKILILDEPTRALDPKAKKEVNKLVYNRLNIQESNVLLMATHDLEEAANLCDRVIMLHQGHIVLNERMNSILSEFTSLFDCYMKHLTIV